MINLKTILFAFAVWCVISLASVSAAIPASFAGLNDITVRVKHRGKSFYGKPLAWDGKEVVLLRRDGRMSVLPAPKQSSFETMDTKFVPMKRATIRKRLVKEYGSKYQVSVTANFIVVHPIGDSNRWAQPFEKLYHRFKNYFVTRGFTPTNPEFPMVAVVLKTRGEFDRFLKSYHDYDKAILGYYSPKSNRIITYDQSEGSSKGQSWFFNASTIIHEATHQTAFNTGIHSRFAPIPRWVSEGLAMMFEAPGVNNSQHYSSRESRINRNRLAALKQYYRNGDVEGRWEDIISNDNLFREDASLAYAMSWGLTFYLAEKHPKKYMKFLMNDAAREPFMPYENRDRNKNFMKYFGKHLPSLQARMATFYRELDIPAVARP